MYSCAFRCLQLCIISLHVLDQSFITLHKCNKISNVLQQACLGINKAPSSAHTHYVHLPNTVVGNRDVARRSMDSSRPVKLCCGICTSMLAADLLSPVSCELEPPWILVCPEHPTDNRLGCNWRIWSRSQHLKLF